MADASGLVKAEFRQLDKDFETEIHSEKWTVVQFNPESLKVAFANQLDTKDASNQKDPSAKQFVGAGTTKLTLQLVFDVNAEFPQKLSPENDVRKLTQRIAYFITPQPDKSGKEEKFLPPIVRFIWGSFQFDGLMESLDETLDFFSPEGLPQRATMGISMSQQRITVYSFASAAGGKGGTGAGGAFSAGSEPLTEAPSGISLQGLVALNGGGDWKQIAQQNGIENPRILQTGQLINLKIR